MQAQQAILTFDESERSLGGRLLKIAIEIDRIEGYSEPHAIAIAWTAEKIGARMGLHGVDLTSLKFAALAHDLGERAMKRDYLLRPRALTWDETLDLWRHPILGEQAAGELKLPRQTQLLIRWHHEWWNGGGYPDGLAGEAIPLGARILRAVDSYFALISDRPHRRRFDRIEAEQIVADLAGIEFDPRVVKLLLQVMAEEHASESAFAYPAPGGDDDVSRPVEDQPPPFDEVVYASAYASRQAETPTEPPGADQRAAPDIASSQAPDWAVDEAVLETRPEIAAVDFASSEGPGRATDEVEGETRTERGAADFTSSNAIGEAEIEVQTAMAGSYLASSETFDEVSAEGRIEAPGSDLTWPNTFVATEVQSPTEMVAADFNSPEAPGATEVESPMEAPTTDLTSSDAPGRAEVEGQTEMAGAEARVTQEIFKS
jgi:HD domain-containing protein